MKTPLRRIKYGAISLAVIAVVAVFAYRITGSYSWIDSIWMVFITVSTVGFGEQSESEPATKVITIGLILFGVSASAYTIGGLLQMFMEGEFDRALGKMKMDKEIEKLDGHIIICGCGRLGLDLAEQLTQSGKDFVIVERNPECLCELDPRPLAVVGDALLEPTLISAGIVRARSIVAGLSTDADNVFITLTARNLSPSIQILAKCEHHSTSTKLHQAGADRIVMPHQIGARKVARMISRPTTADLIELFDDAPEDGFELDEILIGAGNSLVGLTLESSGIKNEYDLLILGIKGSDGKLVFNPPANAAIGVGATLLVIGKNESVNRLRTATQA